jgi:hypothetical protein
MDARTVYQIGYPICYECRHCHIAGARHGFSQYDCVHPEVVSRDIVTGHKSLGECHEQRKDDTGICGVTGKLWEPKVSQLAKIRIWWDNLDVANGYRR